MINPQIKEICQQHNIDYVEAVLYLTAVFYNLPLSTALEKALQTTIKQVNVVHIVERDYLNKSIKWNVSLFGEDISNQWKWVDTEYRILFRNLRPDRAGSSVSCLKRMKDFFKENPEVRKDDVIAAAKLYISELTNPDYLQGADYFIKKGVGSNVTSRLSEYLERIKLRKEVKEIQTSKKMGEI